MVSASFLRLTKINNYSFLYDDKVEQEQLTFAKSSDRLGIFYNNYYSGKGFVSLTVLEAIQKGLILLDGQFSPEEVKFALTAIAQKKKKVLVVKGEVLFITLGLTKEDILNKKICPNKIINFPVMFWNTGGRNYKQAITDLENFNGVKVIPELVCLSECEPNENKARKFFGNYYTIAGKFSDGDNDNTYRKALIIYKRVNGSGNVSFQKLPLTGSFLTTAKATWGNTAFDNKGYRANMLKCFIGSEYIGLIEFIHWPSPSYHKDKLILKTNKYFRTVTADGLEKVLMIGDWNININEKYPLDNTKDKYIKAIYDFLSTNRHMIIGTSDSTYKNNVNSNSSINTYDWALSPNRLYKKIARLETYDISPVSDHKAIIVNIGGK